MKMKKWSDEAWQAALPYYENILRQPFIRELAAGSLSDERFRFYISQDSLYIADYSRVLSAIASRVPHTEQAASFIAFAADGVAVENRCTRTICMVKYRRISQMPVCYTRRGSRPMSSNLWKWRLRLSFHVSGCIGRWVCI